MPWSGPSVPGVAAVDHQHRAGDPARPPPRRGTPRQARCPRPPPGAGWPAATARSRTRPRGGWLHALGLGQPGRHRVDRDAVLAQLGGERAGERPARRPSRPRSGRCSACPRRPRWMRCSRCARSPCLRISSDAALQVRKTPSRLTAMIRRHSAKSMSSQAVKGTMAALLTSMSSLPKVDDGRPPRAT